MTASEIMSRSVVAAPSHMPVGELAQLLAREGVSGVPVVSARGNVVGVVSHTDITEHWTRRKGLAKVSAPPEMLPEEAADGYSIEDYSDTTRVKDIMTPVVYRATIDTPLIEVIETMLLCHVHRLIVIDSQGKLAGIVTTTDLIRAMRGLLERVAA